MADPSGIAPAEVIVLAGGEVTRDIHRPALHGDHAVVIAADAGLTLAHELGLHVDLVAGDMDSVTPDALARARAAGSRIETHPVDKDRTDLAIALDHALDHAPARVTLVGGHGGRLDHHLANLLLIASARYADLEITAHMGPAQVTVVRAERDVHGRPGALVSLLPMHGPARGVTTRGLRFALDAETLDAGSSRGVSNEFVHDRARVRVDDGVVVVVQPGSVDQTRSTEDTT